MIPAQKTRQRFLHFRENIRLSAPPTETGAPETRAQRTELQKLLARVRQLEPGKHVQRHASVHDIVGPSVWYVCCHERLEQSPMVRHPEMQ
jgi:hypothetical protein